MQCKLSAVKNGKRFCEVFYMHSMYACMKQGATAQHALSLFCPLDTGTVAVRSGVFVGHRQLSIPTSHSLPYHGLHINRKNRHGSR